MVCNNGLQGNAFSVCVCMKCIRIWNYWLLHYQNRKTTDLFFKIWYAPDCLRIVCSTVLKLCRTESTANYYWRIISVKWFWSGRHYSSQVVSSWFSYNNCIHDNYCRRIRWKDLLNSRSSSNPSFYSKIRSFIFEDVERNHSVRQWGCYFTQFFRELFICMKSYKTSTGKPIRPLSTIL
jgi:hypothetical protein